MNRRIVNLVCYIICLLCLFAGTVQGVALLWVGLDQAIVWKGLGTTALIFLASLTVVLLNAIFAAVPMPKDRSTWGGEGGVYDSTFEDDEDPRPRWRDREP